MKNEAEQHASKLRWTWRRIVKVLLAVAGTAIALFVALVVIRLMVRDKPPVVETRSEAPAGDSVAKAAPVDEPKQNDRAQRAMGQAGMEMNKPVGKAWKWLAVQQEMLRRVRVNQPELEDRVTEAEAKFNESFGKPVPAIESRMGMAIEVFFQESKETATLAKEEAIDYIELVENRARGEIAAPMLKAVLAYQYKEAPHEELTDGFTQVYSTEGEPKATGLVLEVTVPKSWDHAPDRRPVVMRRFMSQWDRAVTLMAVAVLDIVAHKERRTGKAMTAAEIATVESRFGNGVILDNIFASGSTLYDMEENREVPESTQIESVEIDGIPALERTSVATRGTGTATFIAYVHGYTFAHKRYLVFVEASVMRGVDESEEEFRAKQERWRPLFRLIASNIVVRSPRDWLIRKYGECWTPRLRITTRKGSRARAFSNEGPCYVLYADGKFPNAKAKNGRQ